MHRGRPRGADLLLGGFANGLVLLRGKFQDLLLRFHRARRPIVWTVAVAVSAILRVRVGALLGDLGHGLGLLDDQVDRALLGLDARSARPGRRRRKMNVGAATGKKLNAFFQAPIHSAVCSAATSRVFFCSSATRSTLFR